MDEHSSLTWQARVSSTLSRAKASLGRYLHETALFLLRARGYLQGNRRRRPGQDPLATPVEVRNKALYELRRLNDALVAIAARSGLRLRSSVHEHRHKEKDDVTEVVIEERYFEHRWLFPNIPYLSIRFVIGRDGSTSFMPGWTIDDCAIGYTVRSNTEDVRRAIEFWRMQHAPDSKEERTTAT